MIPEAPETPEVPGPEAEGPLEPRGEAPGPEAAGPDDARDEAPGPEAEGPDDAKIPEAPLGPEAPTGSSAVVITTQLGFQVLSLSKSIGLSVALNAGRITHGCSPSHPLDLL